MNCRICNSEKVVDKERELCRKHHIEAKEAEWLDNIDINNLGIVKWCKELLPEFAYNDFAELHKKMFIRLLKLYDPNYRNKYERFLEFISFRESAKSTAANTLFSSYVLANNGKTIRYNDNGEIREFIINERNITIVSETHTSAEDFTVRIRDAFSTSQRLRYYYQFQIQDAIDSFTGEWSKGSFKINGCYVIAVGAGQQIRGKIKGASRPTLLIVDDIYSENNTVTEDRRGKIKRWWNNSVVNSIDNILGKIVVLGTILHEDTILIELRDNPQWITEEFKVMDIDLFHEFIHNHIKVDWDLAKATLPFDDVEERDKRLKLQRKYFDDLQASKDWKLAWPERIDLYLLAQKFKENVHNQSVDGLYQEYFHVVVSPESKKFRRDQFQRIKTYELKYEYGYNWIRIETDPKWYICNIEFGIDLSGGRSKDDSVITVVAALIDGRLLVLHQAIGKWSLRDDTHMDSSADRRMLKVITDKSAVKRTGIVDECFRLYLRFRPKAIKIGVAGEEGQVVYLTQQVFQANRVYDVAITERPQTVREGKKEERISYTLLSYYETRMVYHYVGLDKLEHQLEYLGKAANDDCADSLECAVWNMQYPYSNLDYEDFSNMKSKEESDKINNRYLSEFNIHNNFREYF